MAFTVQGVGYAHRALMRRLDRHSDISTAYACSAIAGVMATGMLLPLSSSLPEVMIALGTSTDTAVSLSNTMANIGAMSIVNTITGAAGAVVGYCSGVVAQRRLYGARVLEHIKTGAFVGAASGGVTSMAVLYAASFVP